MGRVSLVHRLRMRDWMERDATLIRRGESGFTLDGVKRERLEKGERMT